MESLTSTVTILTSSLATTNEQLVTTLALITVLKKDLTAAKGIYVAPNAFSKTHYFHTYGPQSGHPSEKSQKPGTEHTLIATNVNRLGGRDTPWPAWTGKK
mgnify:CR=1 FL=1